jgi:hypothetical protein
MTPLTDLDRAIREALQVEPGADLPARIRARVAEPPVDSRLRVPKFALAAIACAMVAVAGASIWRQTDTFVAEPMLPHRDLIVLSPPSRVVSSRPSRQPLRSSRATANATNVVVSRSEMLALQRLFSGVTVAPPALTPPADELSIPELAIEPIAPFPAGSEGVRR